MICCQIGTDDTTVKCCAGLQPYDAINIALVNFETECPISMHFGRHSLKHLQRFTMPVILHNDLQHTIQLIHTHLYPLVC